MVNEKISEHRERELRLAASSLVDLYSENNELTAFTALDGEEWDETQEEVLK